jgi:hypothetical protein
MVTFDVLAFLVACLLVLSFQRAGSALMNYRGLRVITCPATGQPAAVKLAAWRVAMRSVAGGPALRIHECSGWPERQRCDQGCVREIAAAPADSLVPNILARWYQGRACACCGNPLRRAHAGRNQPGLISSERKLIEWQEIPPQNIPQTLATASPVCRACVIAETHTW